MSKPHPLSIPIESLRPGTFTDGNNATWSFSEGDIADLASGYDATRNPAPVVVGHPKMDSPAVGIISAASKVGEKLCVEIDPASLDPQFAADVKAKRYFRVSLRLFTPNHPANPNPGKWSIRHLGFLGAHPPAITGLAPVFAACDDDDGPVVDFSAALDGPWWSVGALFRRMRDWMIGSQGLDTADKIIPEWQVAAVEDAARMPEPDAGFAAGATSTAPQEITVNEQQAAALQAENARLTAELTTARNAAALLAKNRIHDENVAFAAALVNDTNGPRLAPQHQTRVVALLDALSGMQSEVEFAAADGKQAKEAPAAAFRAVLESAAVIVPAGAAAGGAAVDADPEFAAGDGAADRAALDRRAREYARTKGVSYAEAVQHCIANP